MTKLDDQLCQEEKQWLLAMHISLDSKPTTDLDRRIAAEYRKQAIADAIADIKQRLCVPVAAVSVLCLITAVVLWVIRD